jgi:hypothetical protein
VQVLACSLLLVHPQGMDPSLVDPPPPNSGPNAPPSPFQRLHPHSPAFQAFFPLLGLGVAIACLGCAAALLRHPAGLKAYSLAAFLHLLCAAPLAPSALLPPALATAVVPIALADRLYARLAPSCVIISSGFVRRFS